MALYPNANDSETGVISSELVSFSPDQDTTQPVSHKLILRHIQQGEHFHISLLYHYYRIFYEITTPLSSHAQIALSTFINKLIAENTRDMPTMETIISNNMLPSDLLDEKGVKEFISSSIYLSQLTSREHSIIFCLYLQPLSDDNHVDTTNTTAIATHTPRINTEWGIPIAFVQLYPLFSSLSVSTNYVVNDLYVDVLYRSLKCGTRLLQQSISYARDILKPLSVDKSPIVLSIRTHFSNKPAQRLYPYMGFIQVERNERLERYIYELVV